MALYVETLVEGKRSDGLSPPADGKPGLALIHGWGMHSGVWKPVAEALSHHFTLYLLDLPGMGYSPQVRPADLASLAAAVAQILPPGSDVCGWSLGGQVAMRLALSHPASVRRLALVSSTPCFINDDTWAAGMPAAVFQRFASDVGRDYEQTLLKFLTLQCMHAEDAKQTLRTLRHHFAARPVPTTGALQDALHILLETDLRLEVPLLKKPVLLVHGDRDTLVPVAAAQWLAQHLPFGRLRVIAGASHAPFLSHQAAFTEALVQFFEPAS